MSETREYASAADQLARGAAATMSAVLLSAYRDDRHFLYVWEQELLLGIQRYRDEGGTAPLDSWTMHFLLMNLDAIRADFASGGNSRMDYNLRADTERRVMAGEPLTWRGE